MIRPRRLLPLLFGPALLACSLVADLGDRTLAGATDAGPETEEDARSNPTDTGVVVTDTGPPPSYCTGITLYASFDTKLTGDVGGDATLKVGGVTQTASGKFGGALSLVHTNDAPEDGAALYFNSSANGNPWPKQVGSLSVWYRVAPGATPDIPVLYRPVASVPPADLVTSGLTYYLRNDVDDVFGLHQHGGGATDRSDQILVFPVSAGAPYLKQADYNHYFTAWRQGTTPTAFLALNGGTGTPFSDPGDVVYPDAGTDGELLVPYRGFTSQPWDLGDDAVGVRLGGPGTNSPEGFLDDLVIWSRVLGFEEVAALYASGQSVGSACRLH